MSGPGTIGSMITRASFVIPRGSRTILAWWWLAVIGCARLYAQVSEIEFAGRTFTRDWVQVYPDRCVVTYRVPGEDRGLWSELLEVTRVWAPVKGDAKAYLIDKREPTRRQMPPAELREDVRTGDWICVFAGHPLADFPWVYWTYTRLHPTPTGDWVMLDYTRADRRKSADVRKFGAQQAAMIEPQLDADAEATTRAVEFPSEVLPPAERTLLYSDARMRLARLDLQADGKIQALMVVGTKDVKGTRYQRLERVAGFWHKDRGVLVLSLSLWGELWPAREIDKAFNVDAEDRPLHLPLTAAGESGTDSDGARWRIQPWPDRSSDAPPLVLAGCGPLIRTGKKEALASIEVRIDETGKVTFATIQRASSPAVGAEAVRAVMEWQFAPCLKSGHPVPAVMTIPFVIRAEGQMGSGR